MNNALPLHIGLLQLLWHFSITASCVYICRQEKKSCHDGKGKCSSFWKILLKPECDLAYRKTHVHHNFTDTLFYLIPLSVETYSLTVYIKAHMVFCKELTVPQIHRKRLCRRAPLRMMHKNSTSLTIALRFHTIGDWNILGTPHFLERF